MYRTIRHEYLTPAGVEYDEDHTSFLDHSQLPDSMILTTASNGSNQRHFEIAANGQDTTHHYDIFALTIHETSPPAVSWTKMCFRPIILSLQSPVTIVDWGINCTNLVCFFKL
jgi:hypothetical protein